MNFSMLLAYTYFYIDRLIMKPAFLFSSSFTSTFMFFSYDYLMQSVDILTKLLALAGAILSFYAGYRAAKKQRKESRG
jgi:hypothetical protein